MTHLRGAIQAQTYLHRTCAGPCFEKDDVGSSRTQPIFDVFVTFSMFLGRFSTTWDLTLRVLDDGRLVAIAGGRGRVVFALYRSRLLPIQLRLITISLRRQQKRSSSLCAFLVVGVTGVMGLNNSGFGNNEPRHVNC